MHIWASCHKRQSKPIIISLIVAILHNSCFVWTRKFNFCNVSAEDFIIKYITASVI